MMRRGHTKKRPKVQTPYFPFEGGLNLVDPPMATKNGMLLGVSNYELLVRGGYRRIDGIERFDGQASPAEQTYWILDYDTGDMETGPLTEPPVGSYFRGCTSMAAGQIGEVIVDSGAWADGDAVGSIIVFNVVGTFIDNEPLSFINAGDGFNCGFSNGFG